MARDYRYPDEYGLSGFPRYAQDKINDGMKGAASFVYNGMWRAMASGIGKGMFAAVATVMAGSAVIGGLAMGTTMAQGVGLGLTSGVGFLGASFLPVLALGAAFGAVYEISKRTNAVHKDLAETRAQVRKLEGILKENQLNQDPERTPGEGIEPPSQYWQQRTGQSKDNPSGQGVR